MDITKYDPGLDKIAHLSTDRPVNVVLSGGGVKGVAHAAFLEYLELHNIQINAIAGSSAGALVGALYASGLRPKEILTFFKTTPIFRYTWLNPRKAGIFDSARYAEMIKVYVKETFEELSMPLTVTAVNIERGRPVYFNEGALISPLLASCAVPAVFSPVMIDGELYSDGGIMDNFPIAPFFNSNLPTLGSYIFKPTYQTHKQLNSILKVSQHANALLLHAANRHKINMTDATVVFPIGHYNTFDTKRIDLIYQTAREHLRLPQEDADTPLLT